MKRKALIVSMALITGMPGWAKAKGEEKSAAPNPSSASLATGTPDSGPVMARDGETSRKAAEVLAQIKQMLRSERREADPVPDRVTVQTPGVGLGLIDQGPGFVDGGMNLADRRHAGEDPRTQSSRPWGVTLRMKF